MLRTLIAKPETFSPRRRPGEPLFCQGHVTRNGCCAEFGEAALGFQRPDHRCRLNPRPKADEIVLGFKPDFLKRCCNRIPTWAGQTAGVERAVPADSKEPHGHRRRARAQRNAFQRMSFLSSLLLLRTSGHGGADVIFAMRLPALPSNSASSRSGAIGGGSGSCGRKVCSPSSSIRIIA